MRKRLVADPTGTKQEIASDANVMASESASVPALILQGSASQAAALLQLKDNLGNILFSVDAAGNPSTAVTSGPAGATLMLPQGTSLSSSDIGKPVVHKSGFVESYAPQSVDSPAGASCSIVIARPSKVLYYPTGHDVLPIIRLQVGQPMDGEGFHLTTSTRAQYIPIPTLPTYGLNFGTLPNDGDTLAFTFPDLTAPAANPELNLVFTSQPDDGSTIGFNQGPAWQGAIQLFALQFTSGTPGANQVALGVDVNASVQNLSDAINALAVPNLLAGASGPSLNLTYSGFGQDYKEITYNGGTGPFTVGTYGYLDPQANRYRFSKYPVGTGTVLTYTFRNSPSAATDIQIASDPFAQARAMFIAFRDHSGGALTTPYTYGANSISISTGSAYLGSIGNLIQVVSTGNLFTQNGLYFAGGMDNYAGQQIQPGTVGQTFEIVFKTTPGSSLPLFRREVQIGATAQDSLNNLISVLNGLTFGIGGVVAAAATDSSGNPVLSQILLATDAGSGVLSLTFNPAFSESPVTSSTFFLSLLSGRRNIYFLPSVDFYVATQATDQVSAGGFTINGGGGIEGYTLNDPFYGSNPVPPGLAVYSGIDFEPGTDANSEATVVAAALQAKLNALDPHSGIVITASGNVVTALRTITRNSDQSISLGCQSISGMGPIAQTMNRSVPGAVYQNGAYAVLGVLKSIDGTNAVVDTSLLVVLTAQEAIPANTLVYYNYSTGQVFAGSDPVTGFSRVSLQARPLGTAQTDTTGSGQEILVTLNQNSPQTGLG